MTHEVVLHGYNVKPGSLQLGTFDSYGMRNQKYLRKSNND